MSLHQALEKSSEKDKAKNYSLLNHKYIDKKEFKVFGELFLITKILPKSKSCTLIKVLLWMFQDSENH